MTIEFSGLRGEADVLALAGILGWAFGFEPADARSWLEVAGLEHVRAARRGNLLIGGLLEVPMGQWFGGRSVPMLGIAGVGVAAEARGERVALSLVKESLRSAKKRGFWLSALYPATVTLYRAAGYELAGSRHKLTAKLRDLPTERGDLSVSPLEPTDVSAVEALYRRVASARTGYLDRGPYVWQRVRESRKVPHHGFGLRGAGGLEGYVYVSQRGPDHERELVVHDAVATTAAAQRRLLGFFADHRSTVSTVTLRGTAADPLLLAVPERVFRCELADQWMLRVSDVPNALMARGYPALDARIDFELDDRSLPENSGRYRLEVSGGTARVTSGGNGRVALDERALAALYTGFLSPAELVHAGMLEGEPAELAQLTALFASPPPAMSDFF